MFNYLLIKLFILVKHLSQVI